MASATTTIRQTTTVTNSSRTVTARAILLNYSYIKSKDGLLNFTELALGVVIFGLVASTSKYCSSSTSCDILGYTRYVSFLNWVVSFYIFCSCILTVVSSLKSTYFFQIFHVFAVCLYISAGIAILAVNSHFMRYDDTRNKIIAAGALSLVAALVHAIHVFLAKKGQL